MKVLICHETSGRVREAFRAMGHDAYSCDLLPSEDGSPFHIQGDVFEVLARFPVGWFGLIGFHPSCTFLCGSGLHWNDRGRGWERTEAALADVRRLMERTEPWYLENPVGIIGTRIRPADQTIQPYEFGEDASKRTCLWLHNLPVLVKDSSQRVAGRVVEWPRGSGKRVERWANQTDSGQNRIPPSAGRWKERSRTYSGIARAFASNWGNLAPAAEVTTANQLQLFA